MRSHFESAFSLFKRGIVGSFHKISIKHLHRYLSEFEMRFNERENPEGFELVVSRAAKTATMPYRQLVDEDNPLAEERSQCEPF